MMSQNWLSTSKRATELLSFVDLQDRRNHLPAQLSGGEQQRVCIARALINRPTLLLADEPTGNLDEESAGGVMRLIRGLVSEFRLALVVVTHDTELSRSFPRRATLREGRLVQEAGQVP